MIPLERWSASPPHKPKMLVYLQLSFHLCYLTILGFSLFAVFTVMLMQLTVNAVLILTPVILGLGYEAPNSQ